MSNSVAVEGYLHVEGFDKFEREAFDKRKIRAGMRRVGKLVMQKAQMNVALSRGQAGYPVNRTAELLNSINFKVSRSGFMVKVAPSKTGAMSAFYPAFLHYGVKEGSKVKALAPGAGNGKSNRRARGARADLISARKAGGWRIAPRKNYMTDALEDSNSEVQKELRQTFADALQ
ncbi:hypothetical protein AUC61_23930 [Pseudomonas sp. S25]|uniref:Phage protein, HK97 gp10 family n=1 Tax=Pseudomonas maioricensis TaxID=1766623 RepID=A0ABS9ZPT1_9PSED|nr:hypothetical protein [Pseudomonas sp. S25]MCI8212585.1 hypothetical protein [Pseudomonas sp. S25]